MLPEDQAGTSYGTWAANGELDIMEGWGSKPTRTGHTIHYGGMWPNNVYSGKEVDFPNAGSIDQWHVYTLEWRSNEIRWYVDGQLVSTKTEWWSSKAMPPTVRRRSECLARTVRQTLPPLAQPRSGWQL
jgi:beta-glucanase (GH16 family)